MFDFLNPYAAAIKLGLIAAAFLAVVGGAIWFVHHERTIGAEKIQAAVQAATQAEQARESKINQDWQQWADGANRNADEQKADTDALQNQLAVATAASDAPCFDAATVDRLRAIGRPVGKASPKPAARR